jgi:hypothetical protein
MGALGMDSDYVLERMAYDVSPSSNEIQDPRPRAVTVLKIVE